MGGGMSGGLSGWLFGGSWLLVLVVLGCLVLSMRTNKVRLLNGVLGNLLIGSVFVALGATVLLLNNRILTMLFIGAMGLIALAIILVYTFLGIILLVNAAIVWRRESHTIPNMLTLFLGILIVLSPFIFGLLNRIFPSLIVELISDLTNAIVLYIAFWFLCFITSFLLFRIFKPALDKDYVIVLGAGLRHGRTVSPLLAARVDRAKKFRDLQLQKTGRAPVLVMSGGQGADEKVPEAQAMMEYAVSLGVPRDQILMEDRSTTTLENMRFSKQIVLDHHLDPAKGVFATSDYHTYRAAGYARYVGLNIDGLGAKTSNFFIPNALIREYVAILMGHKWFHVVMLGGLMVLSVGLTLVTTFFSGK